MIRKLALAASLLVVLAGVTIALHTYLTAPPGSIITWQPGLLLILLALLLIALLALNFKLHGAAYYRLLLAAALALALTLPFTGIAAGLAGLGIGALYLVERHSGEAARGESIHVH